MAITDLELRMTTKTLAAKGQSQRTPGWDSPHIASAGRPPARAYVSTLDCSTNHVLQHRLVQTRVRKQLPQLRVLFLELLHASQLRRFSPEYFFLQTKKVARGDAQLARNLIDRRAKLLVLQGEGDPLRGEARPLHDMLLSRESQSCRKLPFQTVRRGGMGSKRRDESDEIRGCGIRRQAEEDAPRGAARRDGSGGSVAVAAGPDHAELSARLAWPSHVLAGDDVPGGSDTELVRVERPGDERGALRGRADAGHICRFATPSDWPKAASGRRSATSAIRTATRWPRRSSACTRRKSFINAARGDISRPWNMPLGMARLVQSSPAGGTDRQRADGGVGAGVRSPA